MKKQELVRKSIQLVTSYYQGDLQPFFDHISENVLWIGPRGGQILQGRENIISSWSAAESSLRFTMGNIEAKYIEPSASALEVILEYYVYTHFPGGAVDEHHQRIHYSWGYEGKDEDGNRIPKVFMIHLSNVTEEQDAAAGKVQVYAHSLSDSRRDSVPLPDMTEAASQLIYGKGPEEMIYYFRSAMILWIESTNHSRHSILHTLEGDYPSIERLRWYEEQFPGVFLRVHTSYLVNPLYVRSLKRFEACMADGTRLPVPQKKYTAFRNQLENWRPPRKR